MNATPQGSVVQQILTEWRQELSTADMTRLGIDYNFLYNRSVSVSLANFCPLAYAALKCNERDLSQPADWKDSPRLREISHAWIEDSLNLGRSLPVAFFIMAAELSQLAQTGVPSDSTTNMLRESGLPSGVAGKLARYQQVDFSQIAPGIARIEKILGTGTFPASFRQDWEGLPSMTDQVVGELRRGLRRSGYDNQDIADIFQRVKPGISGTAISRMLSGEALRNGVGPGILEVLANRSVEAIIEGLTREFSLAREARMRKGRLDPHPSVLIRDVFGLPEECCSAFSSPTALTLESSSAYNLPLAKATVVEAIIKLEQVLDQAIVNRQKREVFIESNDFFDVMRRADESMLITRGVLGRARMEQMLHGDFIPPLSQVKQMLQLSGVPAFVEVKYRMLYGDHNAMTLNAEQRFVDSLCEEQAETRNAYRAARETARNPWVKSTFERFFRAIGEGSHDYDLQLERVLKSFKHPGEVRGEILAQVCEAFIETRSANNGYPECVNAICAKYPKTSAWFDRTLDLAAPVLGACGPRLDTPVVGRLSEQLFNKLLKVTRSPDDSELAGAWRAMRAVMRVLPGVSRDELVKIIGERSGCEIPEPKGAEWVPFKFNDITWQALEASHREILVRNAENRLSYGKAMDQYLNGLFENARISRDIEFRPTPKDDTEEESSFQAAELQSDLDSDYAHLRGRGSFDLEREGDFDRDFPLDAVIEIRERPAPALPPVEVASVEEPVSSVAHTEMPPPGPEVILPLLQAEVSTEDELGALELPTEDPLVQSAPELPPLSRTLPAFAPFSRVNINSIADARSRVREFMRRIEAGESIFSDDELD